MTCSYWSLQYVFDHGQDGSLVTNLGVRSWTLRHCSSSCLQWLGGVRPRHTQESIRHHENLLRFRFSLRFNTRLCQTLTSLFLPRRLCPAGAATVCPVLWHLHSHLDIGFTGCRSIPMRTPETVGDADSALLSKGELLRSILDKPAYMLTFHAGRLLDCLLHYRHDE